jgi:hypothetical protein
MARQDTCVGYYNYPVAATTSTSELIVLAPTASGTYPGFPSPVFPLSTTTYPAALILSVPPDIALSESWDGHSFEIVVAGRLTTSATSNFTLNMRNVTYAASYGATPSGSAYKAASTSGTGVTTLLTGTATAVGTGGASVNFIMKSQWIWDSVSKTLAAANAPTTYQLGASVTTTATNATVTSLGSTDLNFTLGVTYSSATAAGALTLTEWTIAKI